MCIFIYFYNYNLELIGIVFLMIEFVEGFVKCGY